MSIDEKLSGAAAYVTNKDGKTTKYTSYNGPVEVDLKGETAIISYNPGSGSIHKEIIPLKESKIKVVPY